MLSFSFLAVYLNQVFSALQKYCLVWDLRQTLLFQDICFHRSPSLLSYLHANSSGFGICYRNPLGIATVTLLICWLLTKDCSFYCFSQVLSFLADLFSISVFYPLACFYCKLLEFYVMSDIMSNMRRARGQGGVIAISDNDFFSVIFEPVSSLLSIFLSFPPLCFHPLCLLRKAASQHETCVCFYSRACLKLVMLSEANILHIQKKKYIYIVGHLVCQELCRYCSVLPML